MACIPVKKQEEIRLAVWHHRPKLGNHLGSCYGSIHRLNEERFSQGRDFY